MVKLLHKGDEDDRRHKIIDASRTSDAAMLPQLLAQLEGDESYENRRHIARALGNIGDRRAGEKLMQMLKTERGLILGEIAHSLGQLRCIQAVDELAALQKHESEWVRQNVACALRLIGDQSKKARRV